ncbi:MAG: DapH/DapD/GlmU-related protein [Thermoplasmata archaeon]
MDDSAENIRKNNRKGFSEVSMLGEIKVGELSFIWPGSLIKGTNTGVSIGDEVTVLDNVVITDSYKQETVIHKGVFISPGAVLKGCSVGRNSFLGMDCVIMEGAEVGKGSIISNDSIVPADMVIPEGKIVTGSPARVVGDVSEVELKRINKLREHVDWRKEEYFTMRERGEKYEIDKLPLRPDEIRALFLGKEKDGGAAEI